MIPKQKLDLVILEGRLVMASGRSGSDFSDAVKKIIVGRAAYRCIVPGCTTPTAGPGAKSDEVALTGTACHIYSAAPKGPRGQGNLSPAQLAAPENGVWACATHGRLIDTNRGNRYPASLLQGWKKLQEAQLQKERDHAATDAGWLDRILIPNSPLFAKDAELVLGRHTLLRGGSFGKTAICEWLDAIFGKPVPSRWKSCDFLTSVTYYVPEKKQTDATFAKEGVRFSVDGRVVAELRDTIGIVHVSENAMRKLRYDDGDADELLAAIFGIDRFVIQRLMPDIQRNGTKWGRDLVFDTVPKWLHEDDEGNGVYSNTEREMVLRLNAGRRQPLETFSSSEFVNVLIDFACALARERSLNRPTILLLDGLIGWFDSASADEIGKYLSRQNYQILLTATDDWHSKTPAIWSDWLSIKLIGPYGDATFTP